MPWSFYRGSDRDRQRYRYEDNALVLQARGSTPADSSPLWFVTGDHAYEVDVEIDADAGATAGLLLFYSHRLYAGLGYSAKNLLVHQYGMDRSATKPAHLGWRVFIRLRNDHHIVTMFHSADGQQWTRVDRRIDVSGYHHNVAYDFLSLRPACMRRGAERCVSATSVIAPWQRAPENSASRVCRPGRPPRLRKPSRPAV